MYGIIVHSARGHSLKQVSFAIQDISNFSSSVTPELGSTLLIRSNHLIEAVTSNRLSAETNMPKTAEKKELRRRDSLQHASTTKFNIRTPRPSEAYRGSSSRSSTASHSCRSHHHCSSRFDHSDHSDYHSFLGGCSSRPSSPDGLLATLQTSRPCGFCENASAPPTAKQASTETTSPLQQ